MAEIISSTHTKKYVIASVLVEHATFHTYPFHGFDINATLSTGLTAHLFIYLRQFHALNRKALASAGLRAF